MINLSERLREIVQDELDPERFDTVQRKVYVSLEGIVGRQLADRMTDEQFDEFGVFVDADDDAGAQTYLETHFPDYHAIVATVLEDHLRVVAAALHIGLLDAQ